jgi:hypothetical protein
MKGKECLMVDDRADIHSIILDNMARPSLEKLHIAVDISSMSRGMMSKILSQLYDSENFPDLTVSILYSIAEFSEPDLTPPDAIDFAPISDFSGWTTSPEKPLIMIMGLGYDTDHAIGVMEYLDPSSTFIFSPEGIDGRFADKVSKANEPLIEMLKEERCIPYLVVDPIATYWMLRSLVKSVLDSARVVLVPMGPKIFVSLCLACQRELGDEVSVWRASSHSVASAKDVVAAGPIIGYTVRNR